MLRELSTVIEELHDGLGGYGRVAAAHMRLTDIEVTLPMDFLAVLRDGGCVLLADVSRAQSDASWIADASRMKLTWRREPVDAGVEIGS